MGTSNSKPELSRRKSFIRRSSQRSLFQTAKRHLLSINRRIDKLKPSDSDSTYNDLKLQLEEVRKELDSVSDILKDKHKEKYEESQKYLQETFEKLEAKVRESWGDAEIHEETKIPLPEVEENRNSSPSPINKLPESPRLKPNLHLNLLKVLPTPENSETQQHPLRSPITPELETNDVAKSESEDENNRSSKASRLSKFGIQVLPPVLPQTRLTMLLENKRHQSENSVETPSPVQSPLLELMAREKYRPAAPDVPQSPTLESPPVSPTFFKKSEANKSTTKSPVFKRISSKQVTQESKTLGVQKEIVENGKEKSGDDHNDVEDGYKIIKDAQEYTNHLERQLKLFKGNRDDPAYFYLQEGFFRNLMKLDTIDPGDDAVLRQEKKIGVKRIEELVKCLDVKITASLNNVVPEDSSDDDVFDGYEPADKKSSINANGKTAIITHL